MSLQGAPAASRFRVVVDLSDQKVLVYEGDKAVRSMTCSTGLPGKETRTPKGEYLIDESGQKRGEWFYSEEYGEGAKYWVGFIGGEYLFHSVPMDKYKRIIEREAALLGKPASHGCIRLSLDDAFWFYKTIPDRTRLLIRD